MKAYNYIILIFEKAGQGNLGSYKAIRKSEKNKLKNNNNLFNFHLYLYFSKKGI